MRLNESARNFKMGEGKTLLCDAIRALSSAHFLNEALGGIADVTRRYVGRGRLVGATTGTNAAATRRPGALGAQAPTLTTSC